MAKSQVFPIGLSSSYAQKDLNNGYMERYPNPIIENRDMFYIVIQLQLAMMSPRKYGKARLIYLVMLVSNLILACLEIKTNQNLKSNTEWEKEIKFACHVHIEMLPAYLFFIC